MDHNERAGGLRAYQLQQVLEIVGARIAEPIQVAELAAAARLSPFHFSRMFKRATGYAPHAYLTRQRMGLARKLLAEGEVSLAEIARRVGYQTQAHFTDVFRKQVGITPGAFRREATAAARMAPPVRSQAIGSPLAATASAGMHAASD